MLSSMPTRSGAEFSTLLPASSLSPAEFDKTARPVSSASLAERNKKVGREISDPSSQENEPLLGQKQAADLSFPIWQHEVSSPDIAQVVQKAVDLKVSDLRNEMGRLSRRVAQLEARSGFDDATGGQNEGSLNDLNSLPTQGTMQRYSMLNDLKSLPDLMMQQDGKDVATLNDLSSLPTQGDGSEAALQRYQEILKYAVHEFHLHEDCWGAATFVIVKDITDARLGDTTFETVLRLVTVSAVLIANLILQFGFVYWIGEKVLRPNITHIQKIYKQYHDVAFDGGQFVQNRFDSLGDIRLNLCQFAISSNQFMTASAFLWVTRCFDEFRAVYRKREMLSLLPDLPPGLSLAKMMKISGDQRHIICLHHSARLMLDLFIFLPRTLISTSLLALGLSYLTATNSFADLLLNNLALGFIFDIDELLMGCFLPVRIAHLLENTKVMAPPYGHARGLRPAQAHVAKTKQAYCHSVLALTVAVAIVFTWFHIQPVIPGFQWDVHRPCAPYLESISKPFCGWFDMRCFPK